MKKALITGITGQDGSYLAELLLKKGYEVHGIIRRSSSSNTGRIDSILDDIHLHSGDVTDAESLSRVVRIVKPNEVFNLSAMSHVRTSFEVPEYTSEVDGLGALRVLEAIKDVEGVRFYQASTSELFGLAAPPQSESTPFYPCSPYGIAKMFAYWTTINYRQNYKMFACNGILFNHESPRRTETFVSRKIAKGLVRCSKGLQDKLFLGNLDAKRDWGYAPEFCHAMWLMLQQDKSDDFVIATGESHTVREFLDVASDLLNMCWQDYVEIDPQFYRPMEVDYLLGDASKAKRVLGWEPKVKFHELVRIMVEEELRTNG